MPGHIYAQTGRWSDAAHAFAAAAEDERGWMAQDKLYGNGHHGHNVHYLATAYSFEGRYDDAVEAAKELLQFKENPAQVAEADGVFSATAQGWFAMLRVLVQFEKWDEILGDRMLPVLARPRQEAWRHWARALAHANQGDPEKAHGEADEFDRSLADYRARTHRANPAELEVARQEMEAHLELAAGHADQSLKLFEQASKAERRLLYAEPPYYPRPVAEPWGRAALKANKPQVSERAFRIALEQYPNDAHVPHASSGAVAVAGAH
jgi:tetratricopeptide (TPR) repeat protein